MFRSGRWGPADDAPLVENRVSSLREALSLFIRRLGCHSPSRVDSAGGTKANPGKSKSAPTERQSTVEVHHFQIVRALLCFVGILLVMRGFHQWTDFTLPDPLLGIVILSTLGALRTYLSR